MKKLTITFDLNVKVEARDEPVTRGHWRTSLSYRDEDWITEEVPPLTHAQLVREIRQRLNDMIESYGVSSSDFHFEIASVTGGRKK